MLPNLIVSTFNTGYKCCPSGCGSECLAVTVNSRHPGMIIYLRLIVVYYKAKPNSEPEPQRKEHYEKWIKLKCLAILTQLDTYNVGYKTQNEDKQQKQKHNDTGKMSNTDLTKIQGAGFASQLNWFISITYNMLLFDGIYSSCYCFRVREWVIGV